MQAKLKLRKSSEQNGQRRARTDHQNIKKMIDNFTKSPRLLDPHKITSFSKISQKHRQQFKMASSYRKDKSSTINFLSTDHKELHSKNKTERLRESDAYKKTLIAIKTSRRTNQNLGVGKPMEGQIRYEIEQKVGVGTFGVVIKARDRKTLDIVAIKKVFQDRKYKNRELEILKTMKHPNVLEMKDHYFTHDGGKEYLNVVTEFYPLNLLEMVLGCKGRPRIPKLKFKVLAYQIFKSLLYLESKDIAHRDIKPHNILITDHGWKAVLCDFGSAKILVKGQQNIAYICSRCYRAPELILGNQNYSPKIDVWSASCVLVQMVTGDPLFTANSNMEQLIEIIKVLGAPSEKDLLQMNPNCDLQKFTFPAISKKSWAKILRCGNFGEELGELMDATLRYSPRRRLSACEVLAHPFFDQIRVKPIYEHLRKQQKIPELFNFEQEFGSQKYNNLAPNWHQKQF